MGEQVFGWPTNNAAQHTSGEQGDSIKKGTKSIHLEHLIRSWMVEHQARSVENMGPGVGVTMVDHSGSMPLSEGWLLCSIIAQFD